MRYKVSSTEVGYREYEVLNGITVLFNSLINWTMRTFQFELREVMV